MYDGSADHCSEMSAGTHLRRRAGIAALALAWLLSPAALLAAQPDGRAQADYPAEDWSRIAAPESAGYSSQRLEELRAYVKTLDTTGLMIVARGRVLFEHGNLSELSYLASVRKSILAMLYGKYVGSGRINLKRTIDDIGFTDIGGLLDMERRATIEHLLSARSGVFHPASNGGDDTDKAPPRGSRNPGTYFLYNNWDFNAAGAVFEKLTGIDIYNALEGDLAWPLQMQDFECSRQAKGGDLKVSHFPAYHMWLSTRDMARLGYLMLREGNWNGRQVIPRSWARRIVRPVTRVGQMNPESHRTEEFGYGFMWWVWDGPRATGPFAGAYAARGAYGQYIVVLPKLDLVVAHKTAVPPIRQVSWNQFRGILDRLLAARQPRR